MIGAIIEILLLLTPCYLIFRFRFKSRLLINELPFLFEILIAFTITGAVIGLYLNSYFGDVIDYYFNYRSIIFGFVSALLLFLAYKTKFPILLFLLDLGLWLFVLTTKGGYKVGIDAGHPYIVIVLYDFISTLIRIQIFSKLIYNIRIYLLIALTVILISIKLLFFGYPLVEKFL